MVVTTFNPKQEGNFYFRIISNHDLKTCYLEEKEVCGFAGPPVPKIVAKVSISSVEYHVEAPKKISVTILDDRLGIHTTPFRDPEGFNESFIIYSKHRYVKFEVHVVGQDENGKERTWAEGYHKYHNNNGTTEVSLKLTETQKTTEALAHLKLKIESSDDPYHL